MDSHNDHVNIDLHGHTTAYAVYDMVPSLIRAAWRKGKKYVKLIHGSPDITSYRLSEFRGGTKWALRSSLRRGEWNRYGWNRYSSKHRGLEPNSGAMTLALRPNPNPDPDYPLPDIAEPAYEYGGRWHRARE